MVEDSEVKADFNMKEEIAQEEPHEGGKSDNEADDDKKSASDGEGREDSQAEEDKDSQAGEDEVGEEEEGNQEGPKSSPEVRRRRPRKD